jgi:tetratricopeptide (TPR) repeat protein
MTDNATIEACIIKAKKAYTDKDYALAGQFFLETAVKFEAIGSVLDAAEMRNNASVALLKAGKASESLNVVAGTAAMFEKAGDKTRQAMALANQATAYEDLHQPDNALRDYQLAVDLFKNTSEHEMLSMVLKRISAIQVQNRKPIHALAAMDAAIDATQKRTIGDRFLRSLMGIIRKLLGQT